MNRSTILLGMAAMLSFSAAPAIADDGDAETRATSGDVLTPPQVPLDGAINAEKITQYDPPPLPSRVVLPKPPEFRISTKSSEVPVNAELWIAANESLKKGLAFLRTRQAPNGAWGLEIQAAPTDSPESLTPVGLAVTALAVKAFVQADPDAVKDERVIKALRMIKSSQQPDGSFDDGPLSNYVTSCVLMGLASVPDNDWHDQIADCSKWLQSHQWDQSEGLSAQQDWFGGAGYGRHGRPDLSNTQMMLDALYESGMSPDEPAFQRALAFVSRTQNLKETNKAPWAQAGSNDGGFIYTPANGGESMASEVAGDGRYGEKIAAGSPRSLKSYGSMTYAGFKSMLYAGLSADDVRVRAAFDWLRHHWSFDENPGLGQQGLFYYYHTLSRALAVSQQNEITDADGVKHNWREEMIKALIARQHEDGSWVNTADRWEEGSPVLVTIYCTLALEEILKPAMIDPTPSP
jgi:squalene-hopene/tetraprenyl-beta-curcumene cyclase